MSHKPTKKTNRQLCAIDLFSGCGGLTYGLRLGGFRVVGAVENDAVAAASYRRNHPNTELVVEDIRKVNPSTFATSLDLKPGDLDLLAACPPCQGFSGLRTKNGAKRVRDKRNALINEVARFAEIFEPKVIMLENVPGLMDHSIYRCFKQLLRRLGYTIQTRVDDVRHFGVPQRRRRLILLAGRGVELKFAAPSPSQVTVRDAIGTLPKAGMSGDVLHDYPENRSAKVTRLIHLIPRDGGGRLNLAESEQLKCHKGRDGFKDVYGRLRWSGISPTITTGCYNPSKGRFLHPEEHRCITMREAALLQTFPPTFMPAAGATKTQVARMIGNALPPEFIRRHALVVRRCILGAARALP